MLSAAQCPLILIVLNRTNGIEDAGVFSIAFAVASLMLYVGLYGLRRFQASDINEKFAFQEYNGVRFMTCTVMILSSLCYCFYGYLFNDYSTNKVIIVFLVCLLKLVQAYTDVIHGNMQQKGRLDVATKCSAIRYMFEILSLTVSLIITKNLLLSLLVSVIVSFVFTFLTSINCGRKYCSTFIPSFKKDAVVSLLVEGFPLFLSLFLNMYISNAPKYAIDAYLNEEIQGIYNMIFMPAFMVMLLSNFIFNPIIKSYAELWLSGSLERLQELRHEMTKQLFFVGGLTVLGFVVAATIGIPVLSMVFHIDLAPYKPELCIVMIGGGALGFATLFSTVITVIRAQKSMLLCYGIAAVAAYILSGFLVKSEGIRGATIMYAVIMTILAVLLGAITFWKLMKSIKDY